MGVGPANILDAFAVQGPYSTENEIELLEAGLDFASQLGVIAKSGLVGRCLHVPAEDRSGILKVDRHEIGSTAALDAQRTGLKLRAAAATQLAACAGAPTPTQ